MFGGRWTIILQSKVTWTYQRLITCFLYQMKSFTNPSASSEGVTFHLQREKCYALPSFCYFLKWSSVVLQNHQCGPETKANIWWQCCAVSRGPTVLFCFPLRRHRLTHYSGHYFSRYYDGVQVGFLDSWRKYMSASVVTCFSSRLHRKYASCCQLIR